MTFGNNGSKQPGQIQQVPLNGRKTPISVFGLGYVGSVMCACFASLGHRTIGVDISPMKVEAIQQGRSPIIEPHMDQLVAEQVQQGRLFATEDAQAAVDETEISFVCVGTPSQRNGQIDLSSLQLVCEQLGRALRSKPDWHTIVIRSTVLPGTIEDSLIPVLERTSRKRAGRAFGVCANPEFMREGSAIADFFDPSFTVLGANDRAVLAPLRNMYSALPATIFEISLRSAEMIKYACNAFHAVKVTFGNEIGALARELGVDVDEVMQVFYADKKLNISPAYLKPGYAFGGSCLPKDVRALTYYGRQMDLELPLLEALVRSNQAHIERAIEFILASGKRKIGLLGLAFKHGSDDLRESPLLYTVKRLVGEGRQVRIFDPHVSHSLVHGANRQFAEREVPHIFELMRGDIEDVLDASELVIIGQPNQAYIDACAGLSRDKIVVNIARLACYTAALTTKAA